jgi:hypothetical protein
VLGLVCGTGQAAFGQGLSCYAIAPDTETSKDTVFSQEPTLWAKGCSLTTNSEFIRTTGILATFIHYNEK